MLKKRFLVQILIFFIFGIILGTILPLSSRLIFVTISIGFVLSVIFVLLAYRKIFQFKRLFPITFIIVFLLSYGYSSLNYKNKFSIYNSFDKKISVEAVILENNLKYTDIKTLSGDIKKGIKIRIYNLETQTDTKDVNLFDKGKFKITLSECPKYVKAEGISFYGKGILYQTEKTNGYYVRKGTNNIKTFFSDKIDIAFSEYPEVASFIKAVILGESSELSDKTYADYGRLGITHIVAVSGLHFTIIVFSLFKLLTVLRIQYKLRIFCCISFSIFYCLLTGSSPSSVRAMIMIIFVLIGNLIVSNPDPLTSLFIAASIILFVTPHSIYSTSFILSFIATFVLIILPSFLTFEDYYHKPKYVKKLNNIVNSVFTTVMISLFIALTLYSRFQNFSLITPLANLIASMPFTIIMYISLFCVIFSPIYLPDFIIKFVSFIINGFHSILRYIANIKGIIIVPWKNLLIIICLFILICVIAAFFFKRKNRNNCFRVISILFIISITVNVFSSWISRNNYNQIIFSKEADSAIIIKGGKVNYIVENENSINADFLLSNGIIDISTLTFDNISNIEKAKEKLQSFNNTNKSDIVYCKEDLSEAKYTENISFDEYNITFAKKENENGLKLYYEGDKNILWLGNDAKRENKYKNVDILVLSESFFKNKYNIKALPTVASEIYFPYKYIDSYSIKYLKKNMPDAKLYSIKEFKYIEKNK